MLFCLPPGTTSWENDGLICTKEVHRPLRNQNRKRLTLLFTPVALGSYPQVPERISVRSLQLLSPETEIVGQWDIRNICGSCSEENGQQSSCLCDSSGNKILGNTKEGKDLKKSVSILVWSQILPSQVNTSLQAQRVTTV